MDAIGCMSGGGGKKPSRDQPGRYYYTEDFSAWDNPYLGMSPLKSRQRKDTGRHKDDVFLVGERLKRWFAEYLPSSVNEDWRRYIAITAIKRPLHPRIGEGINVSWVGRDKRRWEAAQIQVRGNSEHDGEAACDSCRAGGGVFETCISASPGLTSFIPALGSCANCHQGGQGNRCTLRPTRGLTAVGRAKGVRLFQDSRAGHRHLHVPHHYDLGTVKGTQRALREARGLVKALSGRLGDFGVGQRPADPDSEHDSDSGSNYDDEEAEYRPRSGGDSQVITASPATRLSSRTLVPFQGQIPMVIIPARGQQQSGSQQTPSTPQQSLVLRRPDVRGSSSGIFGQSQGQFTTPDIRQGQHLRFATSDVGMEEENEDEDNGDEGWGGIEE